MTLAIWVTPRASRTEIIGVRAMSDARAALAIRVASPPADGQANAVLIDYLGEALGVGRSSISLRSGAVARLKLFRVSGNGQALAARLAELIKD